MSSNYLKIEHYILGQTLGVGAFGKVKVAKHEFTQNNVAIKIINKKKMKNSNMSAKIKREIRLLRYFNHPNIIRLYEVLETQSDIYVVMEYVENGELFDLISQKGKLPESEARFFFQQIIAGVEYCHNNLVAHRDLKPENILIDETKTIKIADFGLSNLMKDGKMLKTSCGSPNYAAPEVISGKKYCGTEVDTWSCGVILYSLLAGFLPFDEEVIPVLFKKIKDANYQMPSHIPSLAQDLIRNMLKANPIERIKFHQIKLHPWVKQANPLFYQLNIGGHKIGPSTKINEDIFNSIRTMEFNFHNFSEYKIRESILKKKDYSFVIAYDLLIDQSTKKDMTFKMKNDQKMLEQLNNSTFHQIKQEIQYYYNDPDYFYESMNACRSSQIGSLNSITNNEWRYGLIYTATAPVLMKAVFETLSELDTTFVAKSSSYKIKCFHKITKKTKILATTLDDEMISFDKELDNIYDNQANSNGSSSTTNSNNNVNTNDNIKNDKFSTNELIFTIQIYVLASKSQHMVDIQRTKGHSLIFLDFGVKFINFLEKNLKHS